VFTSTTIKPGECACNPKLKAAHPLTEETVPVSRETDSEQNKDAVDGRIGNMHLEHLEHDDSDGE
jgi:hypothetical protein